MALIAILIDDVRFTDLAGTKTEQTQIGIDSGVVTVETTADGRTVSRPATEREIAAYEARQAQSVRDTAAVALKTATTIVQLRDAIVGVLGI